MTREKVIRATIAEAIDKLMFINYCHNRKKDATMPTDWYPVYGKEVVAEMEKRYQEERHANVHPVFRVILQGVCND